MHLQNSAGRAGSPRVFANTAPQRKDPTLSTPDGPGWSAPGSDPTVEIRFDVASEVENNKQLLEQCFIYTTEAFMLRASRHKTNTRAHGETQTHRDKHARKRTLGQKERQTDKQTDRQTNKPDRRTGGQTNGQTDARTEAGTERRRDGRRDGRRVGGTEGGREGGRDGRTNGQTNKHTHLHSSLEGATPAEAVTFFTKAGTSLPFQSLFVRQPLWKAGCPPALYLKRWRTEK